MTSTALSRPGSAGSDRADDAEPPRAAASTTSSRRGAAGAATLLAGQAAGHAASFARNLIVARMIPAADFGIASTFAISMSLLEMLGDLSLDKLLVQARDGDDPRVQSTAQFLQVARGASSAVLLFLLAGILATAFGAPETRWAFQMLALVPLVQGLAHLDVRRFHRGMRYLPGTFVDAVPQVATTLIAWPLAIWLGDYRVMLWCVLLQTGAATILSHVVAERRYAWSLDRGIARRALAFGWPLVVNALLMFAAFQGDRVIVGTSYGLAQLGAYSLAFSIAFVPTSVVARVATPLALPALASAQDDPARFAARAALCSGWVSLATAAVAVPLVLCGGALVIALFGTKYAAAADVVPWLAAMQAVRILRVAPTLAAVARADTLNSMLSNLWRSAALGAMAAAAALHADLPWIAASGLAGEILALAFSVLRLRRLHAVPIHATLRPAGIAFAGTLAALGCVLLLPAGTPVAAPLALAVALAVGTGAALLAALPDLRRGVAGLSSRLPRAAFSPAQDGAQ